MEPVNLGTRDELPRHCPAGPQSRLEIPRSNVDRRPSRLRLTSHLTQALPPHATSSQFHKDAKTIRFPRTTQRGFQPFASSFPTLNLEQGTLNRPSPFLCRQRAASTPKLTQYNAFHKLKLHNKYAPTVKPSPKTSSNPRFSPLSALLAFSAVNYPIRLSLFV